MSLAKIKSPLQAEKFSNVRINKRISDFWLVACQARESRERPSRPRRHLMEPLLLQPRELGATSLGTDRVGPITIHTTSNYILTFISDVSHLSFCKLLYNQPEVSRQELVQFPTIWLSLYSQAAAGSTTCRVLEPVPNTWEWLVCPPRLSSWPHGRPFWPPHPLVHPFTDSRYTFGLKATKKKQNKKRPPGTWELSKDVTKRWIFFDMSGSLGLIGWTQKSIIHSDQPTVRRLKKALTPLSNAFRMVCMRYNYDCLGSAEYFYP